VSIFLGVLGAHLLWIGAFPDRDPAQDGWLTVPGTRIPGWLERYAAGGHYWMGYTYGLSLAFAAVAFRSYRERRSRSAARAALGSVTLSGFLAVAGCFLLGCCGSPMLGVYLSLFGAGFLPFAKPLVAGITTFMIALCYLWMRRKERRETVAGATACGCSVPGCQPDGAVLGLAPGALEATSRQPEGLPASGDRGGCC
jgi:hypothetical protein